MLKNINGSNEISGNQGTQGTSQTEKAKKESGFDISKIPDGMSTGNAGAAPDLSALKAEHDEAKLSALTNNSAVKQPELSPEKSAEISRASDHIIARYTEELKNVAKTGSSAANFSFENINKELATSMGGFSQTDLHAVTADAVKKLNEMGRDIEQRNAGVQDIKAKVLGYKTYQSQLPPGGKVEVPIYEMGADKQMHEVGRREMTKEEIDLEIDKLNNMKDSINVTDIEMTQLQSLQQNKTAGETAVSQIVSLIGKLMDGIIRNMG